MVLERLRNPGLGRNSHVLVGHRSGVAASILKRNGFTRFNKMLGGITALERLGLPLQKADDAKKAG